MAHKNHGLTIQSVVKDFCEQLDDNTSLVIGLSGGIDSIVLTHALSQYLSKTNTNLQLTAVHINHNLQNDSLSWQVFSEQFANQYAIPFKAISIKIGNKNRQGLEAVARNRRYQALLSVCNEGDYLLTAHHQQDQVETILLNLFRGTGIKGLLGMPSQKQIASSSVIHARPLLKVKLADISAYANQYNLDWIDDPSNTDTAFKRNFIRHKILPKIHQGGGDIDSNIVRMANNLTEDFSLLSDLAHLDLARCSYTSICLNLNGISDLDWSRQKNVIRFWLDKFSLLQTSLTYDIYQWLKESFELNNLNAHPSLLNKEFQIRVEKHSLYLLRPLAEKYDLEFQQFTPFEFGFDETIIINYLEKYQSLQGKNGIRIRNIKPEELSNKKLKKWFKANKVVFWNRKRWPVIYDENNTLEVIGFS
jgi:tRNA(Ile)-lysidine synthase